MSEARVSCGGSVGYYPSSGPSYRTVQLTLPQAVEHVLAGEMEPHDLLRQLPNEIKTVLESHFGKKVQSFSREEALALVAALGASAANSDGSAKVDNGRTSSPPASASSGSQTPQAKLKRSGSFLGRAVFAAVVATALALGAYAAWRWLGS